MSEITQQHAKIRYSIASDGGLKSKPQINSNGGKYYEFTNNIKNFVEILSWCKKLNLLNKKTISQIESNSKLKFDDKLKLLIHNIEENAKQIPMKNIIIFENVVKNVLLLDDPNLVEYTEKLQSYEFLDKLNVQKTSCLTENKSVISAYPMQSKNRGVLFFVNMLNVPLGKEPIRCGAEYDKIYMIELFREYGFTIYYYEDLLADTFWKLVHRLINDQYLNDTDSLVFAVASHGDDSNNIQFYYDQTINVGDIVSKFNDLNCKVLFGKPKILLFPCCRGAERDIGVARWRLQMDSENSVQPSFNDMLICYATVHGYASIRDINFGSWYIESFCKVLANYGHTHDIERMLHLIVQEINRMNEKCNAARLKKGEECIFLTPSFVRRDFNKLLFFNPGFVDNSMVES